MKKRKKEKLGIEKTTITDEKRSTDYYFILCSLNIYTFLIVEIVQYREAYIQANIYKVEEKPYGY